MEQNEDVDQRCEIAKVLGDGITKMIQGYRGRVEEFLLQDLKPDTERLEIEDVARVIVTPRGVEVYTFDDKIFMIEFGGTIVKKMNWVNTPEGEAVLEEDESATRQLASNTARQQDSNYKTILREARRKSETPLPKAPYVPV